MLWITKREALSKCIVLLLLLVVQLLVAIHWIAQLVLLILINWIVIYPVDSDIRLLNNKDQMCVRITVNPGEVYPPLMNDH